MADEKEVLKGAKKMYRADTKREAVKLFRSWKNRWKRKYPRAVKCIEKDLDELLNFLELPLPKKHQKLIRTRIRTTNVIERLNKEFKRRTKPMEIVAGENACYTLLAFISLKMEVHWRSNPVGKVRYNLPALRNLIEGNFTQSS